MLPARVKIVEVGPRDGLQSESLILPVVVRAELIDRLTRCGFSTIEAGSLVSPKAVPQLAESETVYRSIQRKDGVEYPLLVGNLDGLERSIRADARQISVFCAATEAFSMANNRCSIQQNLERIRSICDKALANEITVRAYLSCTLGCPFEGKVDAGFVAKIAGLLIDYGCYEVSLADTIGVGTAGSVSRLLETVSRQIPLEKIAVHFHDTYGQALANVLVALQSGVNVIDSSVAGLGGCPFAGNASGNLASEDLLYMLDGMGIETGIHLNRLIETAWIVADIFGRQPESRVSKAIGRKLAPEFSRYPKV